MFNMFLISTFNLDFLLRRQLLKYFLFCLFNPNAILFMIIDYL